MSEKFERAVSQLNGYKEDLLALAEMAIPENKYPLFRKQFLDKLGKRGFEADLKALFDEG